MKTVIIKQCENPKCSNPAFKTTNPKKKYHDLQCKNQAAYWYKVDKYAWEILMQKLRHGNILVLEYLYTKSFLKNTEETLVKFGFNFGAAYISYLDEKGNKIFRFGNLGLKQIESNTNPKYNNYTIVTFNN